MSAGAPQRDARQPPPPQPGARPLDPSRPAGPGPAVDVDDIVVLRDVKKNYDGQEVLKGINFVARRKETVVLIGGSGAGKTTLLRLIVALDRPSSGQILVE